MKERTFTEEEASQMAHKFGSIQYYEAELRLIDRPSEEHEITRKHLKSLIRDFERKYNKEFVQKYFGRDLFDLKEKTRFKFK